MSEFELHCWKLREFTLNKAGHILNLMDEIVQVFSLRMNREKSIFHFEKYNSEPIGNSVHTAEYLVFGKTLLARLYLKVKCIFECIFEDSSDLENLPLLDIEQTLILQFCFPDDSLKPCFLTRCLYFSPQLMKRGRNKNEFFKYFWRMILSKKFGNP